MNSLNWPASSVWVFIAQLVQHCSANAEATGSNPVEAPKIFFGLFLNKLQLLKLRFTAMVIFISDVTELSKILSGGHSRLDALDWVPLYSSRRLQWTSHVHRL